VIPLILVCLAGHCTPRHAELVIKAPRLEHADACAEYHHLRKLGRLSGGQTVILFCPEIRK
jgi:hypothetical protein